ncbi:MAG: BatA and WFA domain-containing protein [Sphingobacteriaceae bacterium]|nr:BatA and WFA domain-containing protein [Sphingobacteriaceae bacterium]
MVFLYPTFLWALLAISIPILIHLFNFRRYTKIYFTNVKFLKELQQESKSKSRLKEVLILITRCLALLFLVLAFSQPILVENDTAPLNSMNKLVSIYIDNSFSMDNVGKQGPLLELAKNQAQQIVGNLSGTDKIQIITNDFEGKHQRFYSNEEVKELIEDIKSSSSVRNISDVIKRQNEFLNSSKGNKFIFIISDGQQTTFNLNNLSVDSTTQYYLLKLDPNKVNNVFIDTCYFNSPLQQKGFIQTLNVKIVNDGNEPVNAASAKLIVNNTQLGISAFSIQPNSNKEINFNFECKESGFNYGSVLIEDYPVTFDDELFFAFNSLLNINVCVINGKNSSRETGFESIFKSDSLFDLKIFKEEAIDYSAFNNSNVIILRNLHSISSGLLVELKKFVENEGCLFILPEENADVESYKNLLAGFDLPYSLQFDTNRINLSKIELENKFFAGVFEKMDDRVNLPIIYNHFNINSPQNKVYETILKLQNDNPVLIRNSNYGGNVYLSLDPMTEKSSNFSKHALFVPTIYRICFSSLKNESIYYRIDNNNVLRIKNEMKNNSEPAHIRGLTGSLDIIPSFKTLGQSLLLYTQFQIHQPGFYTIEQNKLPVFPIAFNYSRIESHLKCYTAEEINDQIAQNGNKNMFLLKVDEKNSISQLNSGINGTPLWKLFVILALTFLLIEILLLRFIK